MQRPNFPTSALIKTSPALTASGQSSSTPSSDYKNAIAYLNVTAASGTTPSMTVTIQDSPDGTNWYDLASFTAVTAAGTQRLFLTGTAAFLRAKYVITGTTPSFAVDLQVTGN